MYEGNSKTITCTVSGLVDLDGYTATFTAKTSAASDQITPSIEVIGSIVGLVITISLDPADTGVSPDKYAYDITITDGSDTYTVVQSTLTILESVKL